MEIIKPWPKAKAEDASYDLIKSCFDTFPIVGALYGQVVPSPLSKRIDVRMNQIIDALNELLEKDKSRGIEDLKNDPEFISFILCATHIAINNHQEEKIRALLNAIGNFYSDLTYDKKVIILNLIDTLTATHLLILSFLMKSDEVQNNQVKGYHELFDLFSKYTSKLELSFFRKCVLDLSMHGLIRISGDFSDIYGGGGYTAVDEGADPLMILEFGHDFMKTIEEPN